MSTTNDMALSISSMLSLRITANDILTWRAHSSGTVDLDGVPALEIGDDVAERGVVERQLTVHPLRIVQRRDLRQRDATVFFRIGQPFARLEDHRPRQPAPEGADASAAEDYFRGAELGVVDEIEFRAENLDIHVVGFEDERAFFVAADF